MSNELKDKKSNKQQVVCSGNLRLNFDTHCFNHIYRLYTCIQKTCLITKSFSRIQLLF